MNIQIYALKKNFDVQKAERYFKERSIKFQSIDLSKKPMGARELVPAWAGVILAAQKADGRAGAGLGMPRGGRRGRADRQGQ